MTPVSFIFRVISVTLARMMNRTRISVSVSHDELAALAALARIERRDTREQAAFLIRRELEKMHLVESLTRRGETKTREVQRDAK
jgi:hypothetical protein